MDKIDRSEMPPAQVGGPIDAVKGDHTAHPTVQDSKTRKAVKAGEFEEGDSNVEYRGPDATANIAQARAEAGLTKDGNLDPNFDGTQPKVLPDGDLVVVGMEDLKEAAAEFDGETVEQQEIDAGLEVADQDEVDDIDPEELAGKTISEISEAIGSMDAKQLKALEKAEKKGKQRAGVAELIERRRNEL